MGEICFDYKTWYVHRISAVYNLGLDIEDETELVCHKCNNPSCFNPNHIYLGSDKTNQKDRADSITHCKHGHEFTPENTYIATNGKYPKRQCRRCKADRQLARWYAGKCIDSPMVK